MIGTKEKLAVLAKIAQRLNALGITWAVGASLMLYLKGIAPSFNDIDLMVAEQDAKKARAALLALGQMLPPKPNTQYKTKCFCEFVVDGADIDLMAGLVIVADGRDHPCPFGPQDIAGWAQVGGQAIPLQSVQRWRRYYQLMGRAEKVRMIDEHS